MNMLQCSMCLVRRETGVGFHITSCGHFYCHLCVVPAVGAGQCPMCRARCLYQVLFTDVQPYVQDFRDPASLILNLQAVLGNMERNRLGLLTHLVRRLSGGQVGSTGDMNMLCYNLNSAVQDLQERNRVLTAQLRSHMVASEPTIDFSTPPPPLPRIGTVNQSALAALNAHSFMFTQQEPRLRTFSWINSQRNFFGQHDPFA